MRGIIRSRQLLALTLAVAMAALLIPAGAAAEPAVQFVPTGTISGVVTDEVSGDPIVWDDLAQDGVPVAIEVWYPDGGGGYAQLMDAYDNPYGFTNVDGTYSMDLEPGTYYLRFFDWWSVQYKTEFYADAFDVDDATPVVVTEGGTTVANMDLATVQWGSAAGMVTDSITGDPVWDVSVQAYEPDGFGGWAWAWGSGSLSLGDWRAKVPAGAYKVQFWDHNRRYLSQYHGGTSDFFASPFVNVAPSHTTPNINAAMVMASRIEGTIEDSVGNPIEGIYPNLYYADGLTEVNDDPEVQMVSDEDGHFVVNGLAAGDYRLVFTDYDGYWTQQAWDGVNAPAMWAHQAAALGEDISVGASQVLTGYDAVLSKASRIAGTVLDSRGPVEWATVSVFSTANSAVPVAVTDTDENGLYVAGNLPAGTYKVRFDFAGPYPVPTGYYPETNVGWYYNQQYYQAKTTWATATPVTTTAGSLTSGINATLTSTGNWGWIDGYCHAEWANMALSGLDVYLDLWDSSSGDYVEYDWRVTGSDGTYRFDHVPAGTHRIRIVDNGTTQFGPLYDPYTYNPVVPAGSGNSYTHYLTESATDMNGAAVGGFWGWLYTVPGSALLTAVPVEYYAYDDFSGEYWYAATRSSGAGGWYAGTVPAGTYRVKAGPTITRQARYYGGVTDIADATDIEVQASGFQGGYDIGLPLGDYITGTVRDEAGVPLEGVFVRVLQYNTDWDVWEPVTWDGSTNGFTDASGGYMVGGLGAGEYKVHFSGHDVALGQKWWKETGEAQSVDQADIITLPGSGTSASGIDAVLTPAAYLRGTVTDQDGKRVENMHVKLWWDDPDGGWALIQSTYAYNDGDFGFGQFSEGEYFVEFVDDTNYAYRPSWYASVEDQAAATAVSIADRETAVIAQTVNAADTFYSPIFGTNRITTAIRASEEAFPDGSQYVVIATGFNWPDALGGAALAGAHDAPILLCNPTYLPWEVMDEIDRLGATDAIIIGGTSAVSRAVESTLRVNLGQAHVTRIAGTDRFKTAAAVAAATVDRLGAAYDGTAFVATGENFPDALGASPLAAAASWPIYLVQQDALPASTATALSDDGVTTALILGQTGAVSSDVEADVEAIVGGPAVRLGGSSRYQTAAIVAQYGVDHVYGLGWNNVAIATGENYPDALAGGVLQGLTGSVMLLTPTGALDANAQAKLVANKATIVEVRYLGGTNAVSTSVRTAIASLLN